VNRKLGDDGQGNGDGDGKREEEKGGEISKTEWIEMTYGS